MNTDKKIEAIMEEATVDIYNEWEELSDPLSLFTLNNFTSNLKLISLK